MTTSQDLLPSTGPRRPRRRAVLGLCGASLMGLVACNRNEAATAPTSPQPPQPSLPPTPPPPGLTKQTFDSADKGVGFEVGEALSSRVMRVFFDPQCPHCARLWLASKPLQDRVRMRWMPVAFISPSSAPQGALLIKAADPAAAMDQHEASLAAGKGGLDVSAPADPQALASVKSNTELWKSLKASSVPYSVYRAGNDGPYGVQEGEVSTAELTRLLGL